jgi:predicted nucleic-acid-binding protein
MIGLDTNVLVRYVTGDDAAQSAAAVRIMHSLASDHQGFVSLLVMAEMVWVLESAYDFDKAEILQVLEPLLQSKELVIERSDIVWQSLRCFSSSNADFADCLIERSGHAAGCAHTLTYDKTATAGTGMRLLK